MYIILSQRIDIESDYNDKLFKTYHYPARYKNQIKQGDIFIYYQGNRHVRDQRYYFGTGKIGTISTIDDINYYAELLNCVEFQNKVAIHYPDGGYIEQLDYIKVRKKINPPWQSSIRPISEKAYQYIVEKSGIRNKYSNKIPINLLGSEISHTMISTEYLNKTNIRYLYENTLNYGNEEINLGEEMKSEKENLKNAIKDFYRNNNELAINDIIKSAENIAKLIRLSKERA